MKNLGKIILFLVAAALLSVTKSNAQVSVGINIQANIAPPVIPVYTQPECPADGYLWQPGYWAYDPDAADYYWVPGVWVAPPNPGLYWTPCYWGYDGGVYVYHSGYWGPHVGFYGGINYGGGFFGVGFAGGAWSGGHFRYNTAVVNINRTVIHNTYIDRNVIVRNTVVNNHVSYNGGNGGVTARPRPEEQRAANERHIQPTSQQMAHQQAAHGDRSQFAKANHGAPAVTAMKRVNPSRMAQNVNHNPTQAQHNQPAARAQQHAKPEQATRNNANQPAARAQQSARNNAAHVQTQRAQQSQQLKAQQQQHAQQQRAPQQRAPQQRPQQPRSQPRPSEPEHERHR